ncbi:hypothetical protein ACQEVF_22835 [Nonomuraea polychroma]|uniref:hypothetical protein n=1 Tax=Nonomuraea polychroma TaxID=46176 RepID=UPI003D8A01E3
MRTIAPSAPLAAAHAEIRLAAEALGYTAKEAANQLQRIPSPAAVQNPRTDYV